MGNFCISKCKKYIVPYPLRYGIPEAWARRLKTIKGNKRVYFGQTTHVMNANDTRVICNHSTLKRHT